MLFTETIYLLQNVQKGFRMAERGVDPTWAYDMEYQTLLYEIQYLWIAVNIKFESFEVFNVQTLE